MSSEARYTRFSEYVLRKISGQVLRCAKKGLWKTEIFLAESHWSRDPENQRRLLVTLGKQELSARVFPIHNKKIRILVWWSVEPPILFPTPFVSKNEQSENASSMLDERGNLNVQKPPAVIKKKNIALDEDSSSSSASVIETDFKRAKKYDKKVKDSEKKKEKKAKKKHRKQEREAKRAVKKQQRRQQRQQKGPQQKGQNKTSDEESDSDLDFSIDLTSSSEEEPKKDKKISKKEKKAAKKKEKHDRKRVDSDEDDLPLSRMKLDSKSHSSRTKKRANEEAGEGKDADLSDDNNNNGSRQSQKKKGY
jgi:hypothetical protein